MVLNKICQQDIEVKEMIGSGSAGKVYKGVYTKNGETILVAVKSVNIYEKQKRK